MTINNNLSSMLASQMQVEQSAKAVSDIASAVGSPELQEVSDELINAIAGQIPQVIAYEANANSIETQSAVMDTLLNIKA